MCKYCDSDSNDCCVFKDSLTGDWYFEVETSEWDGYCDDFVHERAYYISYCPYCGRKLEDKKQMDFQTSPKIENWTKIHKESGCKSRAAAGEQFQYTFIPSGIVECQIVECLVCGEKCKDYVE